MMANQKSHHLMTLSARASTLGGIVRPICLAAFRLMISSNFFGCSTGRSAGFAPFKILSTYVAARPYAIRHKPTSFHMFAFSVNYREPARYREVCNLRSVRN